MANTKTSRINAPEFDLEKTLNCGQVFHWERRGDGFVGAVGEAPVYVEQRGKRLQFAGVSATTIRRYFALDHSLGLICASFPDDPAMNAAQEFCRGLRIIRQPKWECLATFICSSMKQVAHIRQMSRALRERFGTQRNVAGRAVYTFPTAERLARCSEAELLKCGLGYRARNLLATAKRIISGDAELEAWSQLDDDALRERLCDLPGVGPKVANCAMLFAYERTRAFPIDVWIARVLRERYFARKRRPNERRLREFAAAHFGEYGGYAQQYLFHHARMTQPRRRAMLSRAADRPAEP